MATLKHKVNIFYRKHKKFVGYRLLIILNLTFFHWRGRSRKVSFGNQNPDKQFYLIRFEGNEEGLLSLFFSVLREIEFADKNKYIPIVDMKNYKNQYSTNETGIPRNIWEYYFTQPTEYTLDDVYQSKNVILSGWSLKTKKSNLFNFIFTEELNKKRKDFIRKNHIGLSTYVEEKLSLYKDMIRPSKTLGVYVRGTDYTAFCPSGHPVQPNAEDIIEKCNAFIRQYDIEKIFLVTEDFKIRRKFTDIFGSEKIIDIEQNYIQNYDGREYLSSYLQKKNNCERGMNYLIKMTLLTRCDFLVASITNGSLFSLTMKEGDFRDKYIFCIGYYD